MADCNSRSHSTGSQLGMDNRTDSDTADSGIADRGTGWDSDSYSGSMGSVEDTGYSAADSS